MKLTLVVTLIVGACFAPEPPVDPADSAGSSALVSPGGQGVDYQGVDYQGVDYQGVDYQGTEYLGVTYGGGSLADAAVVGTDLVAWRATGATAEQRFPDRICTWDASRTFLFGCTSVDLSTAPSPLAGSKWKATFINDSGLPVTVTLRIGTGAGHIGAVQPDTRAAMFSLSGYTGTSCPSIPKGPLCDNPNGCRTNCDLFLYDVRVEDGKLLVPFCRPGERALALADTWSRTGERQAGGGRFTFACTNGTIAKCTRWGYRPFGRARKCATTGCDKVDPPMPLADYHQACIRAATADYCANGHSHTKNGTLVDFFDFEPHQSGAKGLIPRTWSLEFLAGRDATAFATESKFDASGATEVEALRYTELGSLADPETGCDGRFTPRQTGPEGETIAAWERPDPAPADPKVSVDSTPMCSHSEHAIGRPLHPGCSECTSKVRTFYGPDYAHCTSQRWDQACVDVAIHGLDGTGPCSGDEWMTKHSECTTGPAIYKYASGCSLRVCLDNPQCCTSSWTSACTAAANAVCTGGRESPLLQRGFCGLALPNSL